MITDSNNVINNKGVENMDKKKYKRFSGYKQAKINIPLGIYDKNNNELYSGDKITLQEKYTGRILWSHHEDAYVLALDYSKWYGENEYLIDSYGKAIKIPLDNGGKMSIILLERNRSRVE